MKLRPFIAADAENLAKHANNFEIARFLTDGFPHPYTLANAEAFIAMTQAEPTTVFAITLNDAVIGGIGLHAREGIERKNMEMGYWLAQPFWRRGIVTEAVREIVDYGFRTFDITRIFARPFGSNVGSQRVLEKAGFALEARFEKTLFKNGAFEDELIYAIRRNLK